ncbi:MAG: cytochrome oxidase subunit III [Alphaproteobacteria bacterium]
MSNRSINLAGWALFVLSALSFITSSLRSGDTAGLIGAALFLVACLLFLIPFFKRDPED